MKADWFGPRLKELREEKNWSQQQLADAAGLAVGIVRSLEQQQNQPTWGTALKLAIALGVGCEAFTQPPAERPPAGPGRPRKAVAPPPLQDAGASAKKPRGRSKPARKPRGKGK